MRYAPETQLDSMEMYKIILTFLVNQENKRLLPDWDFAQELDTLLESSRKIRDCFLSEAMKV